MLKKWIQQRLQKAKKISAAKNEKEVCLKESTRALKNPGCGWDHIYTFDLSKKSFLYIDCEEEELVLLLVDIHAFRGCEQIPKEALEWFSIILTFFEQHDKGIILRIVYDTKGRGMENEPSSIKIVKSHMKQLGSIIYEHMSKRKSLPGKILVHQGLFVGSWDNAATTRAVNYWWGLRSGAEDLEYQETLPSGTRQLLDLLETLQGSDNVHIFPEKLYDNEDNLHSPENRVYSPKELMEMDWLDACVHGKLPHYDELDVKTRTVLAINGLDNVKGLEK